jgi:hypothetical protein
MVLATLAMTLMMQRLHDSGETLPWIEATAEVADGIADGCVARKLPGMGAEECVSFLVEWAFHESRFDVTKVHDGGAGLGLFGTHQATLGRPVPEDAAGQVEGALELFAISWRVCSKRPYDERASWYAAGGNGCDPEALPEGRAKRTALRAHDISKGRLHSAARLLRVVSKEAH